MLEPGTFDWGTFEEIKRAAEKEDWRHHWCPTCGCTEEDRSLQGCDPPGCCSEIMIASADEGIDSFRNTVYSFGFVLCRIGE